MSSKNAKTAEIVESACAKLKASADKLKDATKELKESQDLLQKACNRLKQVSAKKAPVKIPTEYKAPVVKKDQPN